MALSQRFALAQKSISAGFHLQKDRPEDFSRQQFPRVATWLGRS